jgi:ADP-ribosyl-[dinitrogen reductase] hydrolase
MMSMMWLTGRIPSLQIDRLELPGVRGRLGLTHCPGRKLHMVGIRWDRDLAADLDVIRHWGARTLVTLNEQHELAMLGVSAIGELAVSRFDWIWMPIPDGDVPDAEFDRRWVVEGAKLRERLIAGEGVVIHCLAGLGRTGTIAARLLVEFGVTPPEAIRLVRAAREGAIENAWQERYVLGLAPPVRLGN